MRRSPWITPIALCWCALAQCADVPEVPDSGGAIAEEIERLLLDLDCDDFSVRQVAFQQLQDLSAQKAAQQLLAELVERAMVDAEISFEVRKQLERLRRNLPRAKLPPELAIDADAIDRLLARLGDDSYARRLGAESRLLWLLGNADAVELIYEQVKRRETAAQPATEQARSLRRVYQGARAAWLADEARSAAPPTTPELIQNLVKQLAASAPVNLFQLTGEPAALVELRDLLANDANIVPVRQALETRLDDARLGSEAQRRLKDVLELTKPAMVAEYWNGGHHRSIQRLLVDVPSVLEGFGTSHFDRIDDQTAHCVTGVNLSEGDYPVGVAIPHPSPDPQERTAFFQLVNLPTPRRRMAYEYQVKQDEAVRYAAVVARTIDRYLALQQPIDERTMVMILQFEPREVSRFAGRYLATIDDRRIAIQPVQVNGVEVELPVQDEGPSIHTQLCSWLAFRGTQEVAPGLLTAIKEDRLLAPNENMSYRYDRYAALAIAQRDPWPDVDHWLEKVLASREVLFTGQTEGPELGATAAGILLRRHGGSVDDFALIPTGDAFAQRCGLEAYRYPTDDAPKQVADWWRSRQEKLGDHDARAESPKEDNE